MQDLGWKSIKELIEAETKTLVFKPLNVLTPNTLVTFSQKKLRIAAHSLCNTATDLKLPKKKARGGPKAFSYR